MTYTVAAICGTDINFVDDVFGAPPGENYLYEGYKGNGDLLLWGNSTSNIKKTPYSFDVTGTKYYTKSTLSPEADWSLPFSNVISCQAAIANGRVLTVSTAVNLSMLDLHVQPMYATLLANYPSYYRCIDNNSVTSYTTKGIPLRMAKFGNDEYSADAFRVCLCLFATGLEFYALEFESIKLTSGVLGRLVLKKSTDGVNWTTFLESLQNGFPFYTSHASADRNFALGSYVGAKCPKSNRVFIGHTGTFFKNPTRLTTSLNLGVTWEGVDIGRFDGLNWYSDNGVMYLCAVRIGDAGCFGTKICDESGNMFPVEWRESAIPWDWSKTRLDAGYVAGSEPEPTPERETYTPVDIHLGDSVTFNLSATSPANPYREGQCKPFTLIWPEANGTNVVIALNIVDNSDTYLQLIDSAGNVVYENDDDPNNGENYNALMQFNYADYSAPFTVVASTYDENNYASMTITVTNKKRDRTNTVYLNGPEFNLAEGSYGGEEAVTITRVLMSSAPTVEGQLFPRKKIYVILNPLDRQNLSEGYTCELNAYYKIELTNLLPNLENGGWYCAAPEFYFGLITRDLPREKAFLARIVDEAGYLAHSQLPEPTPEPEPIASEYSFTINGQSPDVMKGIGTLNEATGTFTGELWNSHHDAEKADQYPVFWCGSDASLAWGHTRNFDLEYRPADGDQGGIQAYYPYNDGTAGVENLPVTLVREYTFFINGLWHNSGGPFLWKGIGTFNEVNSTFTGHLWERYWYTVSPPSFRYTSTPHCGSDGSCASGYASDTFGYGGDSSYNPVDVENLIVTLVPEPEREESEFMPEYVWNENDGFVWLPQRQEDE